MTSRQNSDWLEQLKAAGSDPHDPDAANIRQAIREIEGLRAVAVAAKALVETAHDYVAIDETSVDEPALTRLESALEAAGYGLTIEEEAELEKRDG